MLASRAIIGMFEVFAMTTVRAASLPSGARIAEPGEFAQHVGQLVAAFAAADVHDHVRVAPLRDLLQQHGLAGAEPAGHGAAAALGDREQHVDHPLPGDQRRPGVSRGRDGRGRRTGHAEVRHTSVPATVAITASPGAGPASRTFSTVPLSPGGTSTR